MNFQSGIHRHYKGGMYRALFIAQDSTNRPMPMGSGGEDSTQESLVIYVSMETGNVCVRSLKQWGELVNGVPRFQWVGH